MKLLRVKLKDFGLYRGEVEFDLEPRSPNKERRPIILFGGKNGAGKTTLLEAIKLGLYGRASQGRIAKQEYFEFLKSKIHKSRGELINPQDSSIEILFDLVIGGEKARYRVTRSWVGNNGDNAHELLRLEKNGELVEDIDVQQQQDFISNIVPENLSQLFFFDGEKIKAIAEDIGGSAAIAESIQTLLGLDLVQKLDADLSIYSQREAKNAANKSDKADLDHHDKRITELKKKSRDLEDKRDEVNQDLSSLRDKIERREKDLAAEGAAFAESLSSEKQREVETEAQRTHIEKELKHLCESAFPLSLCPQTAAQLRSTLEAEAKCANAEELRAEIEGLHRNLSTTIKRSRKIAEKSAKDAVLSLVDEAFTDRLKEFAVAMDHGPLLDHTPAEKARIEKWLHEASHAKDRLGNLCSELEQTTVSIAESRRKQNRAPQQDVLAPIYKDLTDLNETKGSLVERLTALETQIASVTDEIQSCERARAKIVAANAKVEGIQRQMEFAERTQNALADYSERLTRMKIDRLRSSIAECFNSLIRKDSFVHDVEIDSKSFEVTLFDKNHNPIGREELSSGEKQLFAISVLWALAKSSGRPLPVIIDTPLGRLDSDHRLNLVEEYFPKAAHQVIVLSTDTEVDRGLFDVLEPSVSHCYHLQYDSRETCTRPVHGYFWGKD